MWKKIDKSQLQIFPEGTKLRLCGDMIVYITHDQEDTKTGFGLVSKWGMDVASHVMQDETIYLEVWDEEESVETTPEFQEMKFQVSDPQEARDLQETLFSMGYSWEMTKQVVGSTDHPYFYTSKTGFITKSRLKKYFYISDAPEYKLQSLGFTVVPATPAKDMTLAEIEAKLGYPINIVD